MPLQSPILDDRSYQQLRDELIRRIPVYTPEWTDHNASDPGVTLVELFAFLGENLLFRFNQIPDATKLAFLKLLRIPLRPASPATALVAATTTDKTGPLVELGEVGRAGAVLFESTVEVKAWPVSFVAMSREKADRDPRPGEEKDFAQAAVDAAKLKSSEKAVYYQTKTVPVDPSLPSAVPVDFKKAVDGMLWVAVIRDPKNTDIDQMRDHALNLGFVPDETIAGLQDVSEPCPGDGSTQPTPETVWEVSTGQLNQKTKQPIYRALTLDGDTTRGLTQQGVVRIRVPGRNDPLGTFAVDDPDLLGTRDLPPEIDDAETAKNVMFWMRAYRRKSSDRPIGRVLWVGANATEVIQSVSANLEFLGTGNAQPSQVVRLAHRPVIKDSEIIEVEEQGTFTQWTAVDGFEASTESDRHYLLDLEAGTATFGNGVRGRAPQIGERIRVTAYRYGGGVVGNVPAKAINKLGALTASNPLPARGGGDSETIEDALDRVPGELRRRDRAVTRGDFRELALATPGGGVGRAETIPLFDPSSKDEKAAGVVSVVVWPTEDRKNPDAPMPDRTLLREVCQWLDARRLITTELWVIPPTYVEIAAAIGLAIKPGYGTEAVKRWVEVVVRQYLAALPPFGPEGGGWPLGRSVNGRELEAAALQVEGVQFLTSEVRLAFKKTPDSDWTPADSNVVPLEAWQVPWLSQITVVEGDPLAPGDALTPPSTGQVPVPIPTLKEEC